MLGREGTCEGNNTGHKNSDLMVLPFLNFHEARLKEFEVLLNTDRRVTEGEGDANGSKCIFVCIYMRFKI